MQKIVEGLWIDCVVVFVREADVYYYNGFFGSKILSEDAWAKVCRAPALLHYNTVILSTRDMKMISFMTKVGVFSLYILLPTWTSVGIFWGKLCNNARVLS